MNDKMIEKEGKMSLPFDFQIQSGPCIVCGRTDYPLSCGGSAICPACDCGGCTEIGGHKYIRLDFIQNYRHLIKETPNAPSTKE